MSRVISLELNELDFDLVGKYAQSEHLLGFRRLLGRYPRHETVAEAAFEHVEPWIQWVTVHTGLDYSRHGVYRLGDITATDHNQIWDTLQREYGASVAAISPMNARTEELKTPFFLPDPWTDTTALGPWHLRSLHRGIRQAVNENATGRISATSAAGMLAGIVANLPPSRYHHYAQQAFKSRGKPWTRASILDSLLADVFITQWKRTRPDFSTLFMNAAAHVQHHYMFSSRHYDGPHKNPSWYIEPSQDPLLDVYTAYDAILLRMFKLVDQQAVRLLVMNGLSQVPNPDIIHYYRPRNHEQLMGQLGLQDVSRIEPRMSRDFLLRFETYGAARVAQQRLERARLADGASVFSVDNRGETLFVKVSYTKELAPGPLTVDDTTIPDFKALMVHVSIENTIHSNRGVLVDTGGAAGSERRFDLPEVFDYVRTVVAEELG